ncbi:hypothetical protein QAD02_008175 [Eretmocerus hayati]|uniref:Uncharacterized protein n=1 Tax=Eretmocerus hayati TaxID=131215 RepID=A0ACC2N721_9HYME|nr:hypothetical protein QAD02_008175 [Eretmocerus hayati]
MFPSDKKHCIVTGCESDRSVISLGIPKDPGVRQKWLQVSKNPEFNALDKTIVRGYHVCKFHSPDNLTRLGGSNKTHFVRGSVPPLGLDHPVPKCESGDPAKELPVHRDGPHGGKIYYECQKPIGHGSCGFLMLKVGSGVLNVKKPTTSSPCSHRTVSTPSNPVSSTENPIQIGRKSSAPIELTPRSSLTTKRARYDVNISTLSHPLFFQSGINEDVIDKLMDAVMTMTKLQKLILFGFDECSSMPHLDLDEEDDRIKGFVEYSEDKEAVMADHASFIVIKSLENDNKLPFAYVIASLADQGSKTRDAIRKLREETEALRLLGVPMREREFFEFFDKVIDSLNGPGRGNEEKKFRKVITETSFHHEFSKEAKEKIHRMRFCKRNEKAGPTLKNIVLTIEGYQRMWKRLSSLGMKEMNQMNNNQDMVENLIG